MSRDSEKHNRRSIRLKEYDYSKPGAYFVTICTSNRKSFFGNMADGVMTLSPIGNVIEKFFQEIPNHFTNVTLDEFVVMPNHLHGIVINKLDFSISCLNL